MNVTEFEFGPAITKSRISLIVICAVVILLVVILRSIFAVENEDTYEEPNFDNDLVYGEQPKVQT